MVWPAALAGAAAAVIATPAPAAASTPAAMRITLLNMPAPSSSRVPGAAPRPDPGRYGPGRRGRFGLWSVHRPDLRRNGGGRAPPGGGIAAAQAPPAGGSRIGSSGVCCSHGPRFAAVVGRVLVAGTA